MREATWEAIRKLAREGKVPVIEIKEAERVVTPPRKRGRPRVVGPKGEVYHYKMHTPNGQPMQCRAFGCNYKFRKDEIGIVCSNPSCKAMLIEYCQAVLDVFSGKMSALDFPMAFRSRHGKRMASGKPKPPPKKKK